MKRGRPKRRHLGEVDRRATVIMYHDLWSIRQIATALDASPWEVRQVLLKAGVTLRPRGRRRV